MIDLTCPCGFAGKVPEKLGGKKVRCKQCGQLIEVPSQDDFQEIDTTKVEPEASLGEKTIMLTLIVCVTLAVLAGCCGIPLTLLVR